MLFFKLLFIFLAIPFVEIGILIKLGTLIGFWPTVAIQVGTAIAGASLARIQGWWIWVRIGRELRSGRMPANEMIDGVLIFVAGLVLLTPGLLTDFFGLLILLPWTREIFRRWLLNKFQRMLASERTEVVIHMP